MVSVLITSEKEFGVDFGLVERVVKNFLRSRNLGGVEVSIFFVDEEKMRWLNKHYRSLNEPTTILSFSQLEKDQQWRAGEDGFLRLGDLVICPKLAARKGFTMQFLLKHGLTNLLSEIPSSKDCRP